MPELVLITFFMFFKFTEMNLKGCDFHEFFMVFSVKIKFSQFEAFNFTKFYLYLDIKVNPTALSNSINAQQK